MDSPNYKVSAPALATARMLWKNLEFRERGKVASTERNVAVLIDLFSQAFRLEGALEHLVRNVRWFNREELSLNMEKAQEALRALEVVRQRLPRFENNGVNGASAPAYAAANALLQHFDVLHKAGSRIR